MCAACVITPILLNPKAYISIVVCIVPHLHLGSGHTLKSPCDEGTLELDAPRVRRHASSSASCSCGARGVVTMRSQVEKQCQDDPEPAPTGHTARDIIDEDIDQGGKRQEDDPQQWQEPAPVECAVHQWRRYPDN